MTPRTTTAVIGLFTMILGVLALFYPELVMTRIVGLAVDPSFSANFVRGEVRAMYGGLFTVIGIYTVLSAMDPTTNRGRLVFIGLLWLGLAAGRLFGVVVDGGPGVFGWISLLFEAAVGGVLVAFSQMAPPAVARAIYDAAPSVTPGPPATPTA